MTPAEIQDINRVIAEAMGRDTAPHIGSAIWIRVLSTWKVFNPADSISDAMEAVDVILPENHLTIQTCGNGGFHAALNGRNREKRCVPNKGAYQAFGETRPAAISLALYEYIKE